MKVDCINYDGCRLPVESCNDDCDQYQMTCADCIHYVNGNCMNMDMEVFSTDIPCNEFVTRHM